MPAISDREVRVLDGCSFCISDAYGDVYGTAYHGLFYQDTRFLSQAILRINGERPQLLSTDEVDYYSASFYLTLPFKSIYTSHSLSIIRNRYVGSGLHEEVIIENYAEQPADITVTMSFDCDFADLFEVKDDLSPKASATVTVDKQRQQLQFDYRYKTVHRQTFIDCESSATINDKNVTFNITIPAKGRWKTCFSISPVLDNLVLKPKYTCNAFGKPLPEMRESMDEWLGRMPKLDSDCDPLIHTFEQSIQDLAALRFYLKGDEVPVLAAGLPWFMTLFGRDSLITAYQCCFIAPDLGACILRTLAKYQGKMIENFSEEVPGKILHEIRFGELTLLREMPHSPYYGSVDSTPLFLILLHEVYRWTGDRALVQELRDSALKALDWIERYGDLDGDGYVEYQKCSPKGLDNQCWKDSRNSVQFHDGTLAMSPIAIVEVQGYVYDARMRMAELADEVWDSPSLAEKLRKQAAELKQQFNQDFWIDKRGGYFAMALDKEKRQVDALTSNMGHLLWSGIVEADKAEILSKQLMRDCLFSGWGIRTMSTLDTGYNPIEYHNGTIWPHDNSLIATGLARYGYYEEANRIIMGILQTTPFFHYRLPEVFAGYPREKINFPVWYPTASSPQAWSTGTPFLFLRTMFGLEPDYRNLTIKSNPQLPGSIRSIQLENLRLYGKAFRLNSESQTVHVDTVKQQA